jgi:predicted flavoprotein YhiN
MAVTAQRLDVEGNRGYRYAEVTAGGVPLRELDLKRLESRVVPGLFLCGEICDVDGPIGGLNFQWAWSSGFVVGCSVGC